MKNDKTALKIIEKYAESYQILSKENAELKSLLKDCEKNIRLNKEVINNLLSKEQHDNTHLFQEENENLSSTNKALVLELSNTKNRLFFIESLVIEKSGGLNKLIDDLEVKVFELENKLKAKESMIKSLNQTMIKMRKIIKGSYLNKCYVEVYDAQPTDIILNLSDSINDIQVNYNALLVKYDAAVISKNAYEKDNNYYVRRIRF